MNTLDIKSLEEEVKDALLEVIRSKGIEDPIKVTIKTSSGKSRAGGGGIRDGGRFSDLPMHEVTVYKVTATGVFTVHDRPRTRSFTDSYWV